MPLDEHIFTLTSVAGALPICLCRPKADLGTRCHRAHRATPRSCLIIPPAFRDLTGASGRTSPPHRARTRTHAPPGTTTLPAMLLRAVYAHLLRVLL